MSVASEIAGSSGRSRSKRPTISAAKCCASAAEPPLPQARILPSASRHSVSAAAARAIAGASASTASCLSCALSAKCCADAFDGGPWASARWGPRIVARFADGWRPPCDVTPVDDVAQPLDARGIERVEQHGVEAARRACARARRDNARPRRSAARAWPRVMLAAAPPKSPRAAQPHLDEHQRVAVARDEIDLAAAAAPVALDDRRARGAARNSAASVSARAPCALARGRHASGRPSAGTISPPLNCSSAALARELARAHRA